MNLHQRHCGNLHSHNCRTSLAPTFIDFRQALTSDAANPVPTQITLYQGCTSLPKFQESPQNSGCHKGEMTQVPYSESTNIMCHRAKFLLPRRPGSTRGELSYLAPLGSENISAPSFKQCFFRGVGVLPSKLSQTPHLPVPGQVYSYVYKRNANTNLISNFDSLEAAPSNLPS